MDSSCSRTEAISQRLLFTGKKGHFGEVSVKEEKNSCCAVLVLKLYQHILNRFLSHSSLQCEQVFIVR